MALIASIIRSPFIFFTRLHSLEFIPLVIWVQWQHKISISSVSEPQNLYFQCRLFALLSLCSLRCLPNMKLMFMQGSTTDASTENNKSLEGCIFHHFKNFLKIPICNPLHYPGFPTTTQILSRHIL